MLALTCSDMVPSWHRPHGSRLPCAPPVFLRVNQTHTQTHVAERNMQNHKKMTKNETEAQ